MYQAFVMYLNPDSKDEYKKRHDELWPELAALLKQQGISNYHISLNEQTLHLFGSMEVPDNFDAERLKQEPVMQRWWQYMAPLMRTKTGSNEPLSTSLTPMFFLE